MQNSDLKNVETGKVHPISRSHATHALAQQAHAAKHSPSPNGAHAQHQILQQSLAKKADFLWRAATGKILSMQKEALETFTFDEGFTYLLVRDDLPQWAGQRIDIIQDQESRQRFQLAMQSADLVLKIKSPSDPMECAQLSFALLGGQALSSRKAA